MKSRKIELIVLAVLLCFQTGLYVFFGMNKEYIHMDEAYSLGLANYDKVEIEDNEDFYDTWHSGDYYEDYLAVNSDEAGQYKQVYENQKNDVHPPFYYLLLRIAMGFSTDNFSIWPGVILNILIYSLITVFMYLILKKALRDYPIGYEIAAALAFLSSVTTAALTNVLYIRMYSLAALNILITVYLHLRMREDEKPKVKWLVLIGLSALIGSLTHYYYLFFLVALYFIYVAKYVRKSSYKSVAVYTLTMVVAGGLSFAIFPHSIQHMFAGYRGEGFIEKLKDIPSFLSNVADYLWTLNVYAFNHLLVYAAIIFALIYIYKRNNKDKVKPDESDDDNREIMKTLYLPTAFYFFVVAVASPYIELRYIAPVCGIIFVLVYFYLFKGLRQVMSKNNSIIVMIFLCVAVLVMPFEKQVEPEVMYSDKEAIVERIEENKSLPTVYFYNTDEKRFLDDILLFAKLDESYIARDTEMSVENYKKITEGKDFSKGSFVFINYGQNNDEMLEAYKEATGLQNAEWIQRLNACDVYYVS